MKNIRLIFFVLCLLPSIRTLAGEPGVKYVVAADVIEKGIKFHDEEKYKEAIEQFQLVNKNDTAYPYALSEIALSFLASDQPLEAIKVCKKGLELHSAYEASFYKMLGDAYDNADSLNKAIEAYREGIKRYPFISNFHYEMGAAYAKHHNDTAAMRCFIKSFQMNPLHAATHWQLGMLAARNHRYTEAILSIQMLMLIENGSGRALNSLLTIDKMSSGEYQPLPEDSIVKLTEGGNSFEEIEEIIRSKSALSDRYKTTVKIKFTRIVKTLQALNEKLTYDAGDKNFWMQTYVPLFVELQKQKMFSGLIYHMFGGVSDEETQKVCKSNKSDVDKMLSLAGELWTKKHKAESVVVNGKTYSTDIRHHGNGFPSAIGEFNPTRKINVGPWVYLYETGKLKTEGSYNNNGELEGEWKFYDSDGNLKKIVNYTNGAMNGKYELYYSNGQVSQKGNNKNGNVDGKVDYYYSTGAKNAIINFVNDKKEGDEEVYFHNGKLHWKGLYKNGNNNGEYKEYYDNGQLMLASNFIDGKVTDDIKEYFRGGQIKTEGKKVNGLEEGEWKYYFNNGQIEKTGNYSKGKEGGLWKEFFRTGTLSTEYVLTSGAKNGIIKYYDEDGVQFSELEYASGSFKKYKYFDKTHKVISSGEERGGKLNFVSYYPDGSKNTEGLFLDGKRSGFFVQYHNTGRKASELNYINGNLNGECKWYFNNGKVKEISNYKNDEPEGYYSYFHKNGKLQTEGYYVKNEREGEWRSYYLNGNLQNILYYMGNDSYGYQQYFDESGRLQFENYYDATELLGSLTGYDTVGVRVYKSDLIKGSGETTTLHINKKINQKATFKNGVKDGEVTYFFPSGKKKLIQHYTDRKQVGQEVSYYPNGNMKHEMYFKDDKNDSVAINYSEDKKITYKRFLKEDNLEGTAIRYHENGNRSSEGKYVNDEKEGYFTYYTTDGTTVRIRLNFHEGKMVSYSYLDKTGNFVPEIPIKLKADKVVSYYQNGTKSTEINLADGDYEGKRFYYYPNEKIESDDTFKDDEVEGLSKEYYENGSLRNEENFLAGEFDGVCKYYNDKGVLVKQINYNVGAINGAVIYYDELTGKVKKKIMYVNNIPYEG